MKCKASLAQNQNDVWILKYLIPIFWNAGFNTAPVMPDLRQQMIN